MQPLRSSLSAAFAATLICLATACQADEAAEIPAGHDAGATPELGLMGTIPIYWGETEDLGELLTDGGAPHWARAQLEADYRLRPLNTLDEASLAGLDSLMLVQPRALSSAENVALDNWVSGGGRLLLFADPMMTGESRFAIGDRRRPQDIVLLSPILDHWGLALAFDDARPFGYDIVTVGEAAIPVNLPGSLANSDGKAECAIAAGSVLAQCAVGDGRAIVLADAAMLDLHEPHPGAVSALDWLLDQSFGETTGD